MKIVIDAYQYSSSITGTDRMAFNFLLELQNIDSENSYTILCSRQEYTKSSIHSKNFKKVIPPFVCDLPLLGRYFSYFWRRIVAIIVRFKNPDVFYSFHNMTLPPKRVAKRMIASNLDLIPVILEDYKNIGRLNHEQQLEEYARVVELADQFLSISEYSKKELSETLGVTKSKINVIQLAADNGFKPSLHSKKTVKGSYIFTIGGSEPRKNVARVIDAYNKLPPLLQNQYKLVIAGGKWHGRELAYDPNDNITELGYVPDEDLPGLYTNASVFVFASTYEGFGFTILEAMAAGVPVINAQGSSLDEVAGNATLSFNPESPAELTEQLTKVLGDEALRQKLVKKGYEQEKKFSWKESALKLHSLLIND